MNKDEPSAKQKGEAHDKPQDKENAAAGKQQTAERDWSNLFRALHLMAYTKPMTGIMRGRKNTNQTKDFYGESEWRYIPPSVMKTQECYLAEDQFNDPETRKEADETVVEKGPLAFSIGDIRYLFVKTISEVPFLVDFINSHLGHYPANQLKILVSRIFSLEELRYDI